MGTSIDLPCCQNSEDDRDGKLLQMALNFDNHESQLDYDMRLARQNRLKNQSPGLLAPRPIKAPPITVESKTLKKRQTANIQRKQKIFKKDVSTAGLDACGE